MDEVILMHSSIRWNNNTVTVSLLSQLLISGANMVDVQNVFIKYTQLIWSNTTDLQSVLPVCQV